jgi:hypothetical protein
LTLIASLACSIVCRTSLLASIADLLPFRRSPPPYAPSRER